MPKKLDGLKIAREIAESKGGACLSTIYIDSKDRMEWVCSEGHIWRAKLADIKNVGTWCQKCASVRTHEKLKLDGLKIANEIAIKRGGICLSTEYIKCKKKMRWRCKAGHEWDSTLDSVKNKNAWCSKCHYENSGDTVRLDGITIANEIASSYGGKCLSNEYINNRTDLMWKCKNGHIFFQNINAAKDCGYWCQKCGIERRATKRKIDGLKIGSEIAKKHGGELISIVYVDNSTKMQWKCKNGHLFDARLNDIKDNNRWCGECNGSAGEKKIINILRNLFPNYNIKHRYKKFDWLKISKYGKQELDIYIPEIKLAIEYDGEQHFKPVRFGGMSKEAAEKQFEKTIYMDKLKNKNVKQHPEDIKYFIRLNYKEKINKNTIIEKLQSNGVL